MERYAVLRRGAWRTAEEFRAAAARSLAEGERMPDDVRWICSYVLSEHDASLGTVCVYEAVSPEAIREHALRAELPIDEIVAVVDTVIVRGDPESLAASGPTKGES